MSNKTAIPEFLGFQIPGISKVPFVTSRTRSLREPTQQDFINARTLPYICVTRDSNSEEPSRVHYAK